MAGDPIRASDLTRQCFKLVDRGVVKEAHPYPQVQNTCALS